MNTETTPAAESSSLHHALGILSAIPAGFIVLLTAADVLARYTFSAPIKGSVEMIEWAMALLIFTAMPLVTRQRGHVSVSLIDGLVKGSAQKFKVILCDLISAIALGIMTWRLIVQGLDDFQSKSASIVLGLPNAPLSFILAFFAAATTLVVLAMIGKNLTSSERQL